MVPHVLYQIGEAGGMWMVRQPYEATLVLLGVFGLMLWKLVSILKKGD